MGNNVQCQHVPHTDKLHVSTEGHSDCLQSTKPLKKCRQQPLMATVTKSCRSAPGTDHSPWVLLAESSAVGLHSEMCTGISGTESAERGQASVSDLLSWH